MISLFTFAALSRTASAVHAAAVRSNTPYDCNAVSGVDVSFSADEKIIHANFPTIDLTVKPPAHGFPGGDSNVVCDATVEFEDWPTQVRFAVANVTWHANELNLAENDNFYSLAAKFDLSVQHLRNYSPIQYPLIFDYASSTLLDLDVDPGIGNKSYTGEFEYFAENPNLVWSTCFGGYLANTTSLTFELRAHTENGGTSAPGWSMDLGLVWEDCYSPDDLNWGQIIHKNWESCTFQEGNSTSGKRERC
ncbi:hypothetical protein F5X99DRAFT_368515 [Biscogniauxia marginata]|nr:hypothetical protein F5X99DRAFT_368515 [Biscogniauxia marginata]